MNIIICGAGKVGFSISKQLSAQGHSVTIIDQSSEDIKKIRISTEKITKRADKIENVDVNLRDNLDPGIEKGSLPNLK